MKGKMKVKMKNNSGRIRKIAIPPIVYYIVPKEIKRNFLLKT
jgi:hypothetical protein